MINTENFTWDEITCHLKGNYGKPIPEALEYNIEPTVQLLQTIRIAINKPIIINSSYRNPEYNKEVGGEKHSLHMLFQAIDFSVPGYTMFDYLALGSRIRKGEFDTLDTNNIKVGGVGIYKNFIHIDCGPRRDWGLSTEPFKSKKTT